MLCGLLQKEFFTQQNEHEYHQTDDNQQQQFRKFTEPPQNGAEYLRIHRRSSIYNNSAYIKITQISFQNF